jgi:hypothetical protein
MSRCLLHKTKLEPFKTWMTEAGIEHRPGRGDFQILQIKTKNGQWQCVFDRIEAPEHYTVAWPLEPIVRRFIRANKESKP